MSNCCCIDFDGYNDIHDSSVVKAKKAHRCCECGKGVLKGDIYQRDKILYDGQWSNFKTCARCVNVASDYMSCGYCFGELAEEFELCFGFDYRNGIPKDFAPCSK